MRGQDITEEDTEAMESTPPERNYRETKNLISCGSDSGIQVIDNYTKHWDLNQL